MTSDHDRQLLEELHRLVRDADRHVAAHKGRMERIGPLADPVAFQVGLALLEALVTLQEKAHQHLQREIAFRLERRSSDD